MLVGTFNVLSVPFDLIVGKEHGSMAVGTIKIIPGHLTHKRSVMLKVKTNEGSGVGRQVRDDGVARLILGD